MSHSARDTALKVLIACRTHGAWADAALKAQLARDQLSPQDAALCSRMVYGVTQNRLRRLGAGEMPTVVDGVIAPEVTGYLELRPQREQHYRNQQQHIEVVGQKVSVAVIAITVRVEHKTLSLTFQREMGCPSR